MHETHEGVQDMACDTFIKVAHKCRRHFVVVGPTAFFVLLYSIVRGLPCYHRFTHWNDGGGRIYLTRSTLWNEGRGFASQVPASTC